MLEYIEHLEERRASRGWRWHGHDLITAICPGERLPHSGLVFFQVSLGYQSTVRLRVSGDQLSGLALVEFSWTLILQSLERGGQIRLNKQLSFAIEFPLAKKDPLALRELRQQFL